MYTCWYVIDVRYFSGSIAVGSPGLENPVGLRAFTPDVSVRPICAAHRASTWRSIGAFGNFVRHFTSFTRCDIVWAITTSKIAQPTIAEWLAHSIDSP